MPKTARIASVCPHGRSKYRCKDCGAGYCRHRRQKSQCRQCGTGYCEHGSRKDRCPRCGTSRCSHGLLRSRCTDCVPLERLLLLSTQCAACGVTQVCRRRSYARGGNGLCAECDTTMVRRKEAVLVDALMALGVPPPSAVDDTMVGGPSCHVHRRRPDVAWVAATHIVNLEVDEDSHAARNSSCEVSKAQDTRFGAEQGDKPLVLLRYNPDQYDGPPSKGAREAFLAQAIIFCLQQIDHSALDMLRPNVIFLFYHTRAQKHILATGIAGFPTMCLPSPPGASITPSLLPAGMRRLRAFMRQK